MTVMNSISLTRPNLFVVPVPAELAEPARRWFADHAAPATAMLGLDEAWFQDAALADRFADDLGRQF